VIVLDAIFTPVRKISYQVENMRVGTETDYNRLIFYIDTDGTISPRDAFLKGLDILLIQLGELKSFRGKGEEVSTPEMSASANEEEGSVENLGDTAIEDIKFSRHTLNALMRAGVRTIGDLSQKTEKDLRLLEGVGDKAIQEIHRELGNFGFILNKE
ncbi:MAG TPA: DNA-directed RNA polymerase subunit alpha C-terminal domain-containing protein, partial [Candidatus Paceibacterota bacterium]